MTATRIQLYTVSLFNIQVRKKGRWRYIDTHLHIFMYFVYLQDMDDDQRRLFLGTLTVILQCSQDEITFIKQLIMILLDPPFFALCIKKLWEIVWSVGQEETFLQYFHGAGMLVFFWDNGRDFWNYVRYFEGCRSAAHPKVRQTS